MAALAGGLLVVDQYFAPYYPCLFVLVLLLGYFACLEMYQLLAELPRPPLWLLVGVVCAILAVGWVPHVGIPALAARPWRVISWVMTGSCLVAFLWEMAAYRAPGGSVVRLAVIVWTAAYLGLFPSFLVQLRWWPPLEGDGPDWRGLTALALTIFVPKVGDIGAYFTGRYLGKHRMTPILSPKKTWEGLAGGLTAAVVVAVVLNRVPGTGRGEMLMSGGDLEAVGFGLTVGLAGVLGDLAESMIKRDCGQKDASRVVPGFGGVLDVIDSVIFAAPIAYWWLRAVG